MRVSKGKRTAGGYSPFLEGGRLQVHLPVNLIVSFHALVPDFEDGCYLLQGQEREPSKIRLG